MKNIFRGFAPRLAGATIRERTIACGGALLAVALTGFICSYSLGTLDGLPLLIAPVGASAILLFTVPSSPLAQPWSIIGGNTLSALVGIVVGHIVPDATMAAAVSVAAAIAAMSVLRCLHPPGGAVALSSALGSPAIAASGYMFAFVPVGLNSLVLVVLGLVFHRMLGRTYPHVAKSAPVNTKGTSDPAPSQRMKLLEADIDVALEEIGQTFDIARGDLERLMRRAAAAALERKGLVPTCSDIMSKDIVVITPETTPEEARAILIERTVRTVPVVDAAKRVMGVVRLRDLEHPAERVDEVMTRAVTAAAADSILSLVGPLTDGRNHAVVIADQDGQLLGLITQTDLIVALSNLAVTARSGDGET